MPICSEVVPPEVVMDDGVRIACHLYPASDAPMAGVGATTAPTRPIDVIGGDIETGVATVARDAGLPSGDGAAS
jgi:hypothetical protein